jgi:hypothetical protein
MGMRARTGIAIAAIVMLAAMPAAAGVCDLQCAAARPAPIAVDANPAASGSCPFHEGSPAPRDSGGRRDGHCPGRGHSPAGAVLIAATSPAGSVASGPAAALAPAFFAHGRDGRADRAPRPCLAVGRSPGVSPLRSILRV